MHTIVSKLFPFKISLYALIYLCAISKISLAEPRPALGEEISPSFLAQVTTDNTVNTQVNQSENVAEITGGETRGSNLFHSFQDFSVPTGNEAFFNNANDISNIFSRVTGGNVSNIDGLIRANGSADLFLINPAGIIFGNNARLDIGGSFYGSSASSILFEEGEFSAADLDNPPLLTINAPIGLGFRDNSGAIINRSTADNVGLQVPSGETIGLIGGDLRFEGGSITAAGGRIELGGLAETGTIDISNEGNLSFPNDVAKSNVVLSNNAVVDISSDGGGLISVNVNNLELTGESLLLADIVTGLGSDNAVAGTIEINSTSISAEDSSLIHADNLGTGQAGTINIITDTLNFTGGSAITASTFGVGDAGIIDITAQDISIDQEFSGIYSNVGLTPIASDEQNVDGVVGNGGIINIDTNTLSLTNGARIMSNSIAQGDGGTVNINATGKVAYIGQGVTPIPAFGNTPVISGSFSQVQQDTGNGNAGEVNIKADSLTLVDKGAVLVDNSGVGGDAGDITIDVANNIFLDRTGLILAQVQGGAEGNGGDINITANSLEALDNSQILADTKGIGNAGNITIAVDETISLDGGSNVLTEVQESAVGNSGDINITANNVIVKNGANITARTNGEGNAGNIIITTNGAIDKITLSNNGEIRSTVEFSAAGNGGNISLTSGELNLNNRSQIIADTAGQGNAGNINIDVVGGDINLNNSNQIQSQTRGEAEGNAGNIAITTDGSLFSLGGNLILADSQAMGDGGNINITAGEQIRLEGLSEGGFPSQVVAGLTRESSEGTGGTIDINAGELILDDLAFISSNTVSNSIGAAGNVTISADNLQLRNNSFINVFTANNFDSGSITINAQTLDLGSGGKILAATDGGGNAGNINLSVGEQIKINNETQSSAEFIDFGAGSQLLNDLQNSPSGIYANTTENALGNAGNVNIGVSPGQAPRNFIISNDGQIDVSSQGRGSGGNIFLASQALELDNNASISASTISGQGGEVTLQIADDIRLDNNSSISAQAFSDANGGNLTIDSRFIIAFPNGNSDIFANAAQGQGGDITINAESLLGIQEGRLNDLTNDIDASSEFNLDGNVNINTPDLNPIQGATELPRNVIKPGATTAQACSNANRETAASNSLTVTGKGGIPATPELPLNSANVIIDGQVGNYTSAIPQPIETSEGKIKPARGIKVTESGEVILTAYRTNNSGKRLLAIKPNCGI